MKINITINENKHKTINEYSHKSINENNHKTMNNKNTINEYKNKTIYNSKSYYKIKYNSSMKNYSINKNQSKISLLTNSNNKKHSKSKPNIIINAYLKKRENFITDILNNMKYNEGIPQKQKLYNRKHNFYYNSPLNNIRTISKISTIDLL